MNNRPIISISNKGGYVTDWSVFDESSKTRKQILYQGSSLKRTGIPPLFPCWNDSGTILRKHGFARDLEWRIKKKTDEEVLMTLESQNIPEIKVEYNHDFHVELHISVNQNVLIYEMKVVNKGKEKMAIAPAIHPYFKINHTDKNKIMTKGIEGFDAKSFDWNTAPPDNHYLFYQSAEIKMPDRTLIIDDRSPQPVIKYMVVWSQPITSEDYDFVCFEPVTGLTGAVKRKEIELLPNQTWEMKLRITASFH